MSDSETILLSYGFRPFFLAAAIWAVVDVVVWMGLFEHGGDLPSRFDPLNWHIHEMLFGFVMAAIAGFLLTAVANWTGRPPVRGPLLGLLVTLWLAGRIASSLSRLMPVWLAVSVDLALPILLAAVVAKEVIAVRNWRNLTMVVPVAVLVCANLLMYLEGAGFAIPAGLGWRLGIVAMLILVSAVAGRIVPAFTRNWLAKRGEKGPQPRGVLNRLSLSAMHTGLLLWAFLPDWPWTGIVLLMAAALNAWRLYGWLGIKTGKEPLLLILHVGYAWLVAGLALLGMTAIGWSIPLSAALHSLTVGTVGTMILAVMTRATRGHTGRALSADSLTCVIYLLISAAALARVLAAFEFWANMLLIVSAGLWATAFLCFVTSYGPMLLRPKVAPS